MNGFFPSRGKKCLPFPKGQDRHLNLSSLLFNGRSTLFLSLKWSSREADHFCLSNAEIKSERSYTSTPSQYTFVECTQTNLPPQTEDTLIQWYVTYTITKPNICAVALLQGSVRDSVRTRIYFLSSVSRLPKTSVNQC